MISSQTNYVLEALSIYDAGVLPNINPMLLPEKNERAAAKAGKSPNKA
ncbi:histone H2A [Trifolium medium]|uniref:Histone H2A n=1 Tax=Trifolium medium TaxID=97028 RepID=A0A392RND2_9FABA|nr:histone H2A [Trifolium medium]